METILTSTQSTIDYGSGDWRISTLLAIVNLLVVLANFFVMYVLISQRSLHTATNFIIFSLTISDLLLGLVILPFSIIQEYFLKWIFGEIWCTMWLALDVLFSTASIYNLLAISFDRYMAVKQPIKYRLISSKRMTKITLAIVWLISAALTIPPIYNKDFKLTNPIGKNNGMENFAFVEGSLQCTPVTSNDFYILFSALISFILPIMIMIILNVLIFSTVSVSTKLTQLPISLSNNKTFITTTLASCDDMGNIMRKHRGGGNCSKKDLIKNKKLRQSQRSLKKHSTSTIHREFLDNEQLPLLSSVVRKQTIDTHSEIVSSNYSITTPTEALMTSMDSMDIYSNGEATMEHSDSFCISADSATDNSIIINNHFLHVDTLSLSEAKLRYLNRIRAINMTQKKMLVESNDNKSFHSNISSLSNGCTISTPPLVSRSSHKKNISNGVSSKKHKIIYSFPKISTSMLAESVGTVNSTPILDSPLNMDKEKHLRYSTLITLIANTNSSTTNQNCGTISSTANNDSRTSTICEKQDERLLIYPFFPPPAYNTITTFTTNSIKSSLRTELRVARTIAIVVGCFIACWLPFTLVYILQAFQICPAGKCISESFITFAFWLGYANSAINPLLYAVFSRDFRSAFRKVLMDRSSSFRTSS